MSEKKGPLDRDGGVEVLSREAVLVIDEILAVIGESKDLEGLRDLLDLTLHRSLAEQLQQNLEEVRKRAWEIADNVIFTWLAFQAPEVKAKFAYLFKRVNQIYGEGWDYFDLLESRHQRDKKEFWEISPDDEYFENPATRELLKRSGFADLDDLNNRTPTLTIRQKNWLEQPLEYRKDYVSRKLSEQIKDALNTAGQLSEGRITDLSDAFDLGDELVAALANLDYKELCQADVVANLVTEIIRKKIGINIGFCINKKSLDGFIN